MNDDSNVIKFPSANKEPRSIIGATHGEWFSVFLEGHDGSTRVIPHMLCREAGENIEIMLDGRTVWIWPKDIAYHAAQFAANAMAIGAGYSCYEANEKRSEFATKATFLGGLPS